MTTAPTLTEAIAATRVQVLSTPPAKMKLDHITVSWARRSTDKNPVKEGERYRGIEVHASTLAIRPEDCRSKFSALLQSTIHSLADAKFANWAKDNMHATECDAAAFTLDGVLTYWAEEKQRSQIDGAKIAEWLKTSATLAALPEDKRAGWLDKLPKIAAPNYRNSGTFTAASAATIVAKLADADIEHPVAVFIATRCQILMQPVESAADLF